MLQKVLARAVEMETIIVINLKSPLSPDLKDHISTLKVFSMAFLMTGMKSPSPEAKTMVS